MSPEDQLLTAFDKVANSNSFLLKAPRKEGDLKRRFLYFVPSRAFKRLLLEADRSRDWHNYHKIDGKGRWMPKGGGFYKGTHVEFLRTWTKKSFADKLRRMLNDGPCWYGRRYPKSEVTQIVSAFMKEHSPDDDEVLQVKPDFLFSHDYLGYIKEELPEKALCYFDGCGCDHCFCWLTEGELQVLLLNGSS